MSFYSRPSKYAKDNGNMRIDLNYDALNHAKSNPQDPIWIQQLNDYTDEGKDTIVLSLEQAKFLADKLQYFIGLLEYEEESIEDFLNEPQEVPNDIDFDNYKE